MTERDERHGAGPAPDEPHHLGRHGACRSSRGVRLGAAAVLLTLLGAAVGAAGTFALTARAHGGALGAAPVWGPGPGGEPHPAAGRIADHLARKAEWVLATVDATPEQEAEVERILAGALERIAPLVQARRGQRAAVLAALAGPEVDRDALEAARADTLAMADAVSAEVLDALARTAEVLTPEQRAELAERVQRHRHWH